MATIPPRYRDHPLLSLAAPLVCQFEGFADRPYLCPGGFWTAGYGHVLRDENGLPLNNQDQIPSPLREQWATISPTMAHDWLRTDLTHALNSVRRWIHTPLQSHQCAALISFTFNVGGGALQCSTLRQVINDRRPQRDIAAQWRRWIYAGGKKLPGLMRRRAAEWQLWRNRLILTSGEDRGHRSLNPPPLRPHRRIP